MNPSFNASSKANSAKTGYLGSKARQGVVLSALLALAVIYSSCQAEVYAALIRNGDFETGDLSGWQALDAETPGSSYGVDQFDVDGDGDSSYAFWTLPETTGDTLRLVAPLDLNKDVTYYLQVPIAESNTGTASNGGVRAVKARIGSTEVASFSFFDVMGHIPGHSVFRHTLRGEFTPPTTGLYAFELTFQRPWTEYNPIRAWVDNVQLRVPEPASGFLALGLSTMAMLLYRRHTRTDFCVLVSDDAS